MHITWIPNAVKKCNHNVTMNNNHLKELSKIIPDISSRLTIYVVSHGLKPGTSFYKPIDDCLDDEACNTKLNMFFDKHELPLRATGPGGYIYNTDLLTPDDVTWDGEEDDDSMNARIFGYPETLTKGDWEKYDNEIRAISYKASNDGGATWHYVDGWDILKSKPDFQYLEKLITTMGRIGYDVRMTIEPVNMISLNQDQDGGYKHKYKKYKYKYLKILQMFN